MPATSADLPFVWPPFPPVEGTNAQESAPYEPLARDARAILGCVSGLTERGIGRLHLWLDHYSELRVRLIVMPYPASATTPAALASLTKLVSRDPAKLAVRVRPLEYVSDRTSNILAFIGADAHPDYLAVGPTEDLGTATRTDGHVNLFLRPDPSLLDAFVRSFDWLWATATDLAVSGVADIPQLVLPQGSAEGARLWEEYRRIGIDAERSALGDAADIARVSPLSDDSAKSTLKDYPQELLGERGPPDGDAPPAPQPATKEEPPSVQLGLKPLDKLTLRLARLYEQGDLVSIDKYSRIPPLDVPIDPGVFGDQTDTQTGSVVRKVSMRVSIIDAATLKAIEKCRQGLRTVLSKFTFPLADNMRWMPTSAREHFESEVARLDQEGQRLISTLLKGDADAFIAGKRTSLVADIKRMSQALGGSDSVPDEIFSSVASNFKKRFNKAQTAKFLPWLSYSRLGFTTASSSAATPWGQAYSMLASIAAYPRKAITDPFFFRGLHISQDDLLESMNVADDALLRDRTRRISKEQCESELQLLARIEETELDARRRCALVVRVLEGDSLSTINNALHATTPE